MEDYPDMVFETYPSPTGVFSDDVVGMTLESFSFSELDIDDVSGLTVEDFNPPFPLGLTTCLEIGYYRYWINKVWDSEAPGGGAWILWESEINPDKDGERFPDPYQSGWEAVRSTYRAWYYLVIHGDDLNNPIYPSDMV